MSDLLGLDIGGSKTRAVRCAGGARRECETGSANLASVGDAEAGRQLDAVLAGLGDLTGVSAVCAGAAGADSPATVARLTALLAQRVPNARVLVVHDTQLLLAAEGLDEGVALISGTGSVAWGRRRDGAQFRAGGWGYLLGDEGSGWWVAREAVRHALARHDRGLPRDAVTGAVLASCGLDGSDELLDHVYGRPDRRYWAARSAAVAELAGTDPAADAILARAADALAGLARCVLDRLHLTGPVVLGGGFVVHRPAVQDLVRDRLPGVPLHVLRADPVLGALHLARALTDAPHTPAGAVPSLEETP
ncbi:ATPase [Pseudonocardia sp. C8]|uniref:N-acetylglucosamine kinase n=1 Tax=Pseudonocardia sp. C8 TaxID=2762759 RepID=UPI0016432497|nr:ATPase [Pseudonocardia sp. C8]